MSLVEQLSEHLSVPEMIGTAHRDYAEENERTWYGTPALQDNARRLAATVFEPVRAIVGPMIISSGYRCGGLNATVGGRVHPLSHHVMALAVDATPTEMTVRDALFAIAHALRRGELPQLDKAIDEFGGRWLHLQATEVDEKPNHWVLSTIDGNTFARVA